MSAVIPPDAERPDAAREPTTAPVPHERSAFGTARVERVNHIDGPLRDRLVEIWTDVSNAGGWVGFVPPVTRHQVAPALDAVLRRVHDGRDWLVVVRTGTPAGSAGQPESAGLYGDVAGFAIVADNDRLLSEHWRWVIRVQVHPDFQGARLGVVLLDGIADIAADDGVEKLHLTVRSGEGLESFYARAGYHEVARIPGAIRVAPGDDRDQVVLVRDLTSDAEG